MKLKRYCSLCRKIILERHNVMHFDLHIYHIECWEDYQRQKEEFKNLSIEVKWGDNNG